MLSFTGVRLGKVEEGERQGEKEKSCTRHPQQRNLGWTTIMKNREHTDAIPGKQIQIKILASVRSAVDIFILNSAA